MPLESSPPGVVDSSSDGPWHPPPAAAATSRRSSIDSQATAATVVSLSVEPLKMERRRSSNVSFERSAVALSEEILGLGLSDNEDDDTALARERSIFLSPTASSLGPSGNEQRTTSGRRGSAPTLQPSRGRFLGHWRRGRRGSTSSLPSSSTATATSNASQGNMQSPSSATDGNEARRSSFSRSFHRGTAQSNIHDDIRAALENLDDNDVEDDDNEAIARAVERMFGNGDVSDGGIGGSRRSSRTIQMEIRNPPARDVAPRRSSLKRLENRRDWSSRS